MAQPVAKFRTKSGISAALWENEIPVNGKQVKVLRATVEKRYKDKKDGSWKSSGSYSSQDIPLVIHCLKRAFAHMVDAQDGDDSNNVPEESAA